jgi:lipopolysaccharide biosynthesis glycosyltransferase
MDCKQWRDKDAAGKLVEHGRSGACIRCAEQDTMNIYFNGRYKILAHRYDMLDRINVLRRINSEFSDGYIKNEQKNAVIAHFTDKPWNQCFIPFIKIEKIAIADN